MEYKIIATDDHVYGPIDLATLRQWVADKRVDADTWVYESTVDRWMRAAKVAEIADLFADTTAASDASPVEKGRPNLRPAHLRRMKVFSEMTEDQLARFVDMVEPVNVRANYIIVKEKEQGDCMYLILDGEVRVRQLTQGKETTLATLETGDFFGEICLFDEGPRSADVVANKDCTLLKITAGTFHSIMDKQPDIAVRFLFAIIRTVESRIRKQNKKYTDSMSFGRSWGGSSALASAAATAAASVRPPARM